jgi:hypothetical protein
MGERVNGSEACERKGLGFAIYAPSLDACRAGDPLSHSFCRGKCCAFVRHNLIASALHRSTRVHLPPTTRPADFMWQVVSSDDLVGIFHAAPISR